MSNPLDVLLHDIRLPLLVQHCTTQSSTTPSFLLVLPMVILQLLWHHRTTIVNSKSCAMTYATAPSIVLLCCTGLHNARAVLKGVLREVGCVSRRDKLSTIAPRTFRNTWWHFMILHDEFMMLIIQERKCRKVKCCKVKTHFMTLHDKNPFPN